jgi:hypothetical protein
MMTLEELAVLLRLPESTVLEMARTMRLPFSVSRRKALLSTAGGFWVWGFAASGVAKPRIRQRGPCRGLRKRKAARERR